MTYTEGAWYATTTPPHATAHLVWVIASGSALTLCLCTARVNELRPRMPSDPVCPDCWFETHHPVATT